MIWQQRWTDVLFLHFPVAARQIAPHLPRHLEAELFAGQAWLSYVFFRLQLRPVCLPQMPGLSSLLELNVRTYVRCGQQTGIYFLRMYADNGLAILASRWLTPLRYERALMIDRSATSQSRHLECRPSAASGGSFSLDFPIPSTFDVPPAGSLDAWLLERYRLFVSANGGSILAADVQHPPWTVGRVHPVTMCDSLSQSHGVALSAAAERAHFSPGVHARFNAFVAADSLRCTDDRMRSQLVERALPIHTQHWQRVSETAERDYDKH